MTTLKDIAEKSGFSIATVSKALNNERGINKETRKKIIEIAKELNYVPSYPAVSVKLRKTNTIGLLISDIANPFFPEIVKGIERVAYNHGFNLILCNTDEDEKKEDIYVDVLLKKRVDGLIAVAANTKSKTKWRKILKFGVPLVMLDRKVEGLQADYVVVDNIDGGFKGIKYLVEMGHRDIGILTGDLKISTGKERFEGVMKALKMYSLEGNAIISESKFTKESAYDATKKILSNTRKVSAIFFPNNITTIGGLKAIFDLGLNIPRDISIVSFDDMDWFSLYSPPITAVAQPSYTIGTTAATILIHRIRDESLEFQNVTLKTELIKRESVRNINKIQ